VKADCSADSDIDCEAIVEVPDHDFRRLPLRSLDQR
jgi:hypothetical protein